MNYQYQIVSKTTCHDGFFRVERLRLRHELFGGGWGCEIERELFERGHAAAVLLYDPERDSVVLVEQFRIGALDVQPHPWLLELHGTPAMICYAIYGGVAGLFYELLEVEEFVRVDDADSRSTASAPPGDAGHGANG